MRFDSLVPIRTREKSLENPAEPSLSLLEQCLAWASSRVLEGEHRTAEAQILKSAVVMREYKVMEKLTLRVFRGFQMIAGDPAVAPTECAVGETAVLHQARLLDEREQDLAQTYVGQYVVFHDGMILASAATAEEAISRVCCDERHLPFVVRRIRAVPSPHYMGGPKRG